MLATTTYAYNYDNTLKTIVHSDLAAGNLSYGYTYGPDGDITQMVTPDDTIDYTLDLRGQVTDVEYDGVELEDYAYDDNGNRTTANGAAYATETGNRMTTDGTYRYEYDDNGNRTLRFIDVDSSGTLNTGDTDITTYAWDYRNRLVTASDQATFGAAVAASVEYIYDAFNNRISKIVDADGDGTAESPVRTNFALLDGEVYLEFNGSTLTHRYMPGPSIDMNLAIEEMHSDGTTHGVLWALTDHQGTVRDVIDSTGAVTNHIQYNSFGHITSQTHGHVNYRFTYTGRELDAETGLYYYRARYYDAENGKFISEDPIAFEGGDANLYRYVGNNPGNGTDPTGLEVRMSLNGFTDKRIAELEAQRASCNQSLSSLPDMPDRNTLLDRIQASVPYKSFAELNPTEARIYEIEQAANDMLWFASQRLEKQFGLDYASSRDMFNSSGLKRFGVRYREWLGDTIRQRNWEKLHSSEAAELIRLKNSRMRIDTWLDFSVRESNQAAEYHHLYKAGGWRRGWGTPSDHMRAFMEGVSGSVVGAIVGTVYLAYRICDTAVTGTWDVLTGLAALDLYSKTGDRRVLDLAESVKFGHVEAMTDWADAKQAEYSRLGWGHAFCDIASNSPVFGNLLRATDIAQREGGWTPDASRALGGAVGDAGVIYGLYRLTRGSNRPSNLQEVARAPRRGNLIHLTNAEGKAGIASSGRLIGKRGIFAVPESAAGQGTAMRVARTGLMPGETTTFVRIPESATGIFQRPAPIGLYSGWKYLGGVRYAPPGSINMTTGAFTPGSAFFGPKTLIYGPDVLFWGGVGTAGGIYWYGTSQEGGE